MVKLETKDNIIAANIARLMSLHDISEAELARRTGIAQTTLNRLLSKGLDAKTNTLKPIASVFNITVSHLIGEIPLESSNNQRNIPIIEWHEIADYLNNKTIKCNYFTIETTASGKSFILKTFRSLRPRFMDNTLLIFDPSKKCNDGDIVLLKDADNLVLKELYYDGTKIYLTPINGENQKIIYDPTQHQIVAVLVQSVFIY